MEPAATYCGTAYPWQMRPRRPRGPTGAQIHAVCRFDPNDRRNTARRFRAGWCVRRQIPRAPPV